MESRRFSIIDEVVAVAILAFTGKAWRFSSMFAHHGLER